MDVLSTKHILSLHKSAVRIACVILFCSVTTAPLCSSTDALVTHLDYLTMIPEVQLPGDTVKCICILYPMPQDVSVNLYLRTPVKETILVEMDPTNEGKYVCTFQLKEVGRYTYWIEVTNEDAVLLNSSVNSFWIATSLNDRDSDGISDAWEISHDFNPEDPSDAMGDKDSDGFSNLDEYHMGTNPWDNNILENILYRLKNNMKTVFLSFFLFSFLLLFSFVGIWRSKTWV